MRSDARSADADRCNPLTAPDRNLPRHAPLAVRLPGGVLIGGVLALIWLLLRSGTRPSRVAYPCQQAALSAATLAFGAPLLCGVFSTVGRRRRRRACTVGALMLLCSAAAAGLWGFLDRQAPYSGPVLTHSADYRAQVFRVSDCPQDPQGDRFVGLDRLLVLMGRQGLKFYRSDTASPVAGPDGIIAADDVVVIKINYQWPQRGGTNTDLLRGLILRLLGHPDRFTGEVVVCENAQFNSTENFDRSENNAQVYAQSPHDVVERFRQQGGNVSHYDWTLIRNTAAAEYSEGDDRDGYIVYAYDPEVQGRVSYPKFRTQAGTHVSLKHGIWDPDRRTYNRERLKFINVPVLKSHSIYAITACIKDYMGVVSGALNTNSHNGIRYGILGAMLGEIRPADLNVLDCIWINAIPGAGPRTSYSQATRRDVLVAGRDPVAVDIWAAKHVLVPAFIEKGYPPPWQGADPDDPSSVFRTYLDRSMSRLLQAGYDVTNDFEQIDAFSWNGAGDTDDDGDVDLADYADFARCHAGPGAEPPQGCEAAAFDEDNDVDLADHAGFEQVFSGSAGF